MKLYFVKGDKKRLLLKNCTEEEAFEEMKRFMKERHFKWYYMRSHTTDDGVTIYDVGSYTEFFHLYRK